VENEAGVPTAADAEESFESPQAARCATALARETIGFGIGLC
jgi:hypothetical protein